MASEGHFLIDLLLRFAYVLHVAANQWRFTQIISPHIYIASSLHIRVIAIITILFNILIYRSPGRMCSSSVYRPIRSKTSASRHECSNQRFTPQFAHRSRAPIPHIRPVRPALPQRKCPAKYSDTTLPLLLTWQNYVTEIIICSLATKSPSIRKGVFVSD